MRLGKIEFYAMNNPLRRMVQKYIEFRAFQSHLKKHGIHLRGAVIMDAGCGSGYSTGLIIKAFSPSAVIAFDYMPEQIRLAKKRGINADFFVGDATQMTAPDASCDAVFVFGVLHHIPEWRKALAEAARVLRPGGVLLVEEPRYLFTWDEFSRGIHESGFTVLEEKNLFGESFKSFLCRKTVA